MKEFPLVLLFCGIYLFLIKMLIESLLSNIKPKCIWLVQLSTLLLFKMIGGAKDFTPVACFFMSGLNDIFYWQADVLILTKSLLMSILLVLCLSILHLFSTIVTYHLQIFCILTLNYQVNRLYNLKITKGLKRALWYSC